MAVEKSDANQQHTGRADTEGRGFSSPSGQGQTAPTAVSPQPTAPRGLKLTPGKIGTRIDQGPSLFPHAVKRAQGQFGLKLSDVTESLLPLYQEPSPTVEPTDRKLAKDWLDF